MNSPLPYDMGNAGDLLKHGVISEILACWVRSGPGTPSFYDPFGGVPWQDPPHHRVVQRVKALNGFTIQDAQSDIENRYLGSGHIARAVGEKLNSTIEVYVGDRNSDRLENLVQCGLQPIELPNYDRGDGYSLLKCSTPDSLVLIDPFADFLPDHPPDVFPDIRDVASNCIVVLFILLDPNNTEAIQTYRDQRNALLQHVWSIYCPPLSGTGILGESTYGAEVVICMPPRVISNMGSPLKRALSAYTKALENVLRKEDSMVNLAIDLSDGTEQK